MQEKIFSLLFEQNEVTWQDIIYGLIKSDEMDPWDLDISLLTARFLETVQKLHEMDFHLSGKVIFAAALFVKIKSERLVEQDIAYLDSILFPQTTEYDEEGDMQFERPAMDVPPLCIRTPQARKRRVSVQDLIKSLERALNTNKRRILRYNHYFTENIPPLPERKVNLTELIMGIFEKIKSLFSRKEVVTFSRLLPDGEVGRKEKILTLIPLLHLDFQKKVDLDQPDHFGEIYIKERMQ